MPLSNRAIAGILLGYDFFALDMPRVLCAVMTIMLLVLAGLMVSRVPYPAIKGMDPAFLLTPKVLGGIAIAVGLLFVTPRLTALVAGLGYLLSGLILSARGERVATPVITTAVQ